MVQASRAWLLGLCGRGAVLGVVVGGMAWGVWGWEAMLAVWSGLGVMLGNVGGLSWLLKRWLGRDKDGPVSAWRLATLFLAKLLVLFSLSYYVLAVAGLTPAGFAAGCMLGLAALSWHVVATPNQSREGADGETPSAGPDTRR